VTILTEKQDIQWDDKEQEGSLGSGVIVSAENHVLTAAHVVQGAEVINIKTSDGKQRQAKLLFSEASADIALLQFITLEPDRPYASIGDSDRLAVGQHAFAIGSPYGLENSFSVGYISGFREFNRLYDGTIKAEYIQTDAAINTGNSGGPIFNSQAEVIGIASSILTQSGGFQGLGFVVAINTAKQLMALENRVWMGIEGVFLNRALIAGIMNRDLEGGLLIERVAKGSPADKAGLRGGSFPGQIMGREFLLGGDLIIQFSTKELCPLECMLEAKKHFSGVDKIPVTYLREGVEMTTVMDVSQSRLNYLERLDFSGP
jgi:serine protease Do